VPESTKILKKQAKCKERRRRGRVREGGKGRKRNKTEDRRRKVKDKRPKTKERKQPATSNLQLSATEALAKVARNYKVNFAIFFLALTHINL
jgi:hypothetical protein